LCFFFLPLGLDFVLDAGGGEGSSLPAANTGKEGTANARETAVTIVNLIASLLIHRSCSGYGTILHQSPNEETPGRAAHSLWNCGFLPCRSKGFRRGAPNMTSHSSR
jgi:hypothetical protein